MMELYKIFCHTFTLIQMSDYFFVWLFRNGKDTVPDLHTLFFIRTLEMLAA